MLSACQEPGPPSPEPVAKTYASAWQKADYQAMWVLLTDESQKRAGEDGFTKRLPRIAEEMTLTSLEAKTGNPVIPKLPSGSPDPARATIPLSVAFHTKTAGDFTRETSLKLVLVGAKTSAQWKIDWSPEAILPKLTPGRLVRMTRVPTSRGRIVAREGTELATFVDAAVVGVVPGDVKSEAGMLASLSPIVGLAPDQIKEKYTQSWVKPDTFVAIKTLSPEVAAASRAKLAVIEGVQSRPQRVRSYPSGLAAQTIGYVGEATEADAAKKEKATRGVQAGDMIGRTGLEAALDDLIGGTFGWRLSIVEATEQPVEMLGETLPVAGPDAVLAIDPAMQAAAEKALGDQKGAIVAEDPWTGEILAIASRPSFDLNTFVSGDSAAIAKFNADPKKPVFNRATFGQYPTGSSFKPVTAAAALRNGAYRPGERVDCPVAWSGYGIVQLNHESGPLGPIDLRTALARSCNTFFYELGKRLNDKDPTILPNEANSFGLGKATDIDFVLESEGIVPSPAWKQKTFPNPADKVWNPGDATNLAIGQGFLLATPLQMANYSAALANDGIVWKPRLVTGLQVRATGAIVKTWDKTRAGTAISTPTDLSLIRDGMRAVVTDPNGTVYFPFRTFQIPVAGKSGTAETTGAGPDGWFIGFAPYDAPSVAFATLIEEKPEGPGSLNSQIAATATRAMLAARFGTP